MNKEISTATLNIIAPVNKQDRQEELEHIKAIELELDKQINKIKGERPLND